MKRITLYWIKRFLTVICSVMLFEVVMDFISWSFNIGFVYFILRLAIVVGLIIATLMTYNKFKAE